MSLRKLVLSCCVLGVAAVLSLAVSWSIRADAGDRGEGRLDPAGTWVQVDMTGNTSLVTVVPTDPSRGEFALVSNDFQGTPNFLGLFPTVVARTVFRGVLVSTGPQTGDFTTLAYATDADGEIVYIMVASGSAAFTGPDTVEATASLGVYGADQDPFGDEPPEHLCVPFSYTLERVPLSLPCEL